MTTAIGIVTSQDEDVRREEIKLAELWDARVKARGTVWYSECLVAHLAQGVLVERMKVERAGLVPNKGKK